MKSGFAKKSLGQNFLQNPHIRDRILAEAGDLKGAQVLEIGPGLGFLTTKLLKAGAHVTAVELDERAVQILQRDFGHLPHFRLINDDILQVNLQSLLADTPYQVIANIPYNITNPIIRLLLEKAPLKPSRAILMVQKEVGEKICCHQAPDLGGIVENFNPHLHQLPPINQPPKQKQRSLLSLSVEIYAETKYCFTVPRTDFSPAPKVDSAIIRLDARPTTLVPAALNRDFFTVVNAGFSEKRKKLDNVLTKFFGIPATNILGDIDGNRRAETLSVEEWLEIAQRFHNYS